MTGAGATATGVGAGTRTHPAAPRPMPTARPTIASAFRTVLNGRMSLPPDSETTGTAGLFTAGGGTILVASSRVSGLVIVLTLPVNEEEGHRPYLSQSAYPAKGTTVGGRTDDLDESVHGMRLRVIE